ncbi:MAG TPA: cytochrome c [Candidatus Elarobacter sp.]|jgi:mono/diheme cytochrome c family protein|nr:cytochrome c [Candidatus Elarobacter sp.]
MMQDLTGDRPVARVDLYLDDAQEPFKTIVPPNSVEFDTSQLDDGPHVLRIEARDAAGNVGRRTIPFVVQNGPGITVTGLRAGERVGGNVQLEVNAFGGNEPFDPVRAESSGPIPVWTWVMSAIIVAWAGWYGLAAFSAPLAYANTPTYASNPVAAAQQPMSQTNPTAYSGRGVAGGFDYAASGERLYTANCSACHGVTGTGVPGAFPPLAGDPVVTANDPAEHVRVVLKGLAGKRISGTAYSSQMPPFAQLSDAELAAIVDHERTSWGNKAPIITPDVVKRAR